MLWQKVQSRVDGEMQRQTVGHRGFTLCIHIA